MKIRFICLKPLYFGFSGEQKCSKYTRYRYTDDGYQTLASYSHFFSLWFNRGLPCPPMTRTEWALYVTHTRSIAITVPILGFRVQGSGMGIQMRIRVVRRERCPSSPTGQTPICRSLGFWKYTATE